MTQVIKITDEENNDMRKLIYHFNSYLDIFKMIINMFNDENKETFNTKWNEMIDIYSEIEKKQTQIVKKYNIPTFWEFSNFNFDKNEVTFIYNEA